MRKNHLKITLLFISTLFFCACSQSNNHQLQTITVQAEQQQSKLYFSGFVQPIKTSICISPIDGTISKLFFTYGQAIKKNQLLLTLVSGELTKNYQDSLADYLSNKQKYMANQATFLGSHYLYKKGLISKNDYLNAINDLQDSDLNYIQARIQLESLLKIIGLSKNEIELLKIGDAAAIQKALVKSIGAIPIYAQTTGIALLPPKENASAQDDSNATISVGNAVKTGEGLVMLGDMSGLSISISVDEININQLQTGMPALITSAAFPNLVLHGLIKNLSAQADDQNQSAGLPSFSVLIVVPHLTLAEQAQIRVGVSAQVTILITHPKTIFIPISAVMQKNGLAYVTIIDKKTKQLRAVVIKTGVTTLNKVAVLQGLQTGDEVVLHH